MSAAMLHRRVLLAACCALALASALPRHVYAAGDPLCVIVAAGSKQTELSLSMLRRVFRNQPTDDAGGNRFIPLNSPPGTRERIDFDKRVLGLAPEEVARYWIDQRIRGSQAPRTANSLDLSVRVVARLPGAISYAPKSLLRADVKVLRIDGKLPGEPGYPLTR